MPSNTATRGEVIPLVIGRRRVGAFIAWVGDDKTTTKKVGGGGKGGGGGGGSEVDTYWQSGMHVLCVGPATKLHAIYDNGKPIWTGPIDSENTPDATRINLSDGSCFMIFWEA